MRLFIKSFKQNSLTKIRNTSYYIFFKFIFILVAYATTALSDSIDLYYPQFQSHFGQNKYENFPLLTTIEVSWPTPMLTNNGPLPTNNENAEINLNTSIKTTEENSKITSSTINSTVSSSDTVIAGKTDDTKNTPTNKANINTTLNSITYIIKKHKAFALVPVKMYLLEWLTEKPNLIKRNEWDIIPSFFQSGPHLFKITFLRNTTATQLIDSFQKTLIKNKIKESQWSDKTIEFFDLLASAKKFKTGDNLLLYFYLSNQNPVVVVQSNYFQKKIFMDTAKLSEFLTQWFGKPEDEKFDNVQKNLLTSETLSDSTNKK